MQMLVMCMICGLKLNSVSNGTYERIRGAKAACVLIYTFCAFELQPHRITY